MVGVKSQGGRGGEGDTLVSWAEKDIKRGEGRRRKGFRNGRCVGKRDGGEDRTSAKKTCIEEIRRDSKCATIRR